MKLSKEVRNLMLDKITAEYKEKVGLVEYNELMIILEVWNSSYKIIPFALFDTFDNIVSRGGNEEDFLKTWLIEKTSNIEDVFNKSRKVIRLWQKITDNSIGHLAYALNTYKVFETAFGVFYLDEGLKDIPINFEPSDRDKLQQAIEQTRKYLVAVLVLDTFSSGQGVDALLRVFLQVDGGSLIDCLSQDMGWNGIR